MPSPESSQEREERIGRILKSVEERLRRELPEGPQTLDQIEETVEQIGEEIKTDIQSEVLEGCGSGYSGSCIPCRWCGGRSRYKADHVRSVVTLHGEQAFGRAYYYCSSCKRGFHPVDAALALGRGQCSIRVRALACRFASYLPFAVAARELELVCGVRLSASSIQRIAKETGAAIGEEWQKRQETLWQHPTRDPKGPAPKQIHVSMDGVMAHVDGAWREVKLGVCYEGAEEGGPTRASYYATLAPSAVFGARMRTVGWVAKEPLCRKVAVVADGSDWIWQETAKHFGGRTQILDFYHVSEHLWSVARTRFGEGSADAAAWVSLQKERLLNDQVAQVLTDIRDWLPATPAQEQVRRKELAYLSGHAHRMRYKSFREAGFHIGSGVMESSCRWVVQQRMKGAGMRWSAGGAENMLQLRSAWCSRHNADLLQAARLGAMHA